MSKGQFRRYEHLERLDHMETAGIEIGRVYVFPKLDGTNASVWLDSAGQVQCGSRNRVLSAEHDNHGFHAWVHGDTPKASLLRTVVASNPGCVHYGEWLVPHTINAYRDEAWRCFWIFDVFAQCAHMLGEQALALGRFITGGIDRDLAGFEVGSKWDFGVDDDGATAGEANDHVGADSAGIG